MASNAPTGTRMIGYNAPVKDVEALDRISMKKWGKLDRTKLLRQAVEEFIEREEHPDIEEERFREFLRKESVIAEVAEAVQKFAPHKR